MGSQCHCCRALGQALRYFFQMRGHGQWPRFREQDVDAIGVVSLPSLQLLVESIGLFFFGKIGHGHMFDLLDAILYNNQSNTSAAHRWQRCCPPTETFVNPLSRNTPESGLRTHESRATESPVPRILRAAISWMSSNPRTMSRWNGPALLLLRVATFSNSCTNLPVAFPLISLHRHEHQEWWRWRCTS